MKLIFEKWNNGDLIELFYNTNNGDYILFINGKKKIKKIIKNN